jgi:O-antigen/teichoic acid export membrane protein
MTFGTAASLLAQAVTVAGQLLLVPALVSAWGAERYGEWLSLTAAVAYLTILDFGVQTYATNRLTQCRAKGDAVEYNRVLHSAWALNLALAGAAILVVLPVLAMIPLPELLQLKVTNGFSAWLAVTLVAIQTIASIPFGLVTGLYRTVDEYPREVLTNVARQVITLVAAILVTLAGGGLVAVAAVQLLSLLMPGLNAWRDVRSRHPAVRLGVREASRSMALSFLHPSMLFLVLQLSGAAVLQGSILLVGHIFGARGVATLVTLRTLANVTQQGISAIRGALWPEVAALDATGEHARLREFHSLLTKLSLLLWFCALVLLHCEGATIVRIWTRGRIAFDPFVMHGLLLLYGSYTYWATGSILLGASNRHRAMAWICASAAGAGLALAWALSGAFGLPGVVFGIAAADVAICSVAIPWMACQATGENYARFCADVIARGALAALPVAAAAWLFRSAVPPAPDIVRIAGLAVVTGVAGVLSFYFLWLNAAERHRISALAVRLLGSIGLASLTPAFGRQSK